MSDFTIKCGSYCPVCRGRVLCDHEHTMQELSEINYSHDVIGERNRLAERIPKLEKALSNAAINFDLILMRLRGDEQERAEGAAICGAKEARAACVQ